MKQYINLLPTDIRQAMRLAHLRSRAMDFFVTTLLTLAVLSGVLFLTRVWLQIKIAAAQEQIVRARTLVSKEDNQKLKKKLTEFNTHLTNLITQEKYHVPWSEVLIAFARLVPRDVAIDNLTVGRANGSMQIRGFARSRDSILLLRDNLLASPYFKNVDFPLSNITKPADADFHYSLSVNFESLRKRSTP